MEELSMTAFERTQC